ncbi:LrgB family protein [Bacterioplanoides sp.]|uniref:LrgB family protein n=1 Tax=Bacterioplanoides sp. TaxID=2066072 RepID=UPI003B5BD473
MISELLSLPLFWATLTIAAFVIGQNVYKATGNSPFLPPILSSVALVVTTLELSDTPYQVYMEGGNLIHIMLGPVIVMLAVPLYQFLHTMRDQWQRIALAVIVGSGTTVACAVLLTQWWVGDEILAKTIATKSITSPVAIAIAEQVGGIAAIASASVIVTGIFGAAMAPALLRMMRQDDAQTVGLTLGICAHAIGTARALELGSEQAAYAAMAMTLTATLHALLLPWIV